MREPENRSLTMAALREARVGPLIARAGGPSEKSTAWLVDLFRQIHS